MARTYTIIVTLFAAGVFAWAVPLLRLLKAFQPLTVAFSIMVAAVFVRLNRGMPSLEWKSVDPDRRKDLTASVVKITIEYSWIISLNAIVLVMLITLTVIGANDVSSWSERLRRIVAGAVGGLVSLCVTRMFYVVWRDIDIVKLQKLLIDGTASRDANEREEKLASEKVESIRSAKVRPVERHPPRAWDA